MIRFRNLSKTYNVQGTRKVVAQRLNIDLESGRTFALLGKNGAGKSSLLQMIAGTLRPDSGFVMSSGTISWPVGFAGSFHPDLTGAQNVRFIARVYGIETDQLVRFVASFSELGKHFHMPVRTYSAGMKARLAFGSSMGVPFDTYLVDEVTAVGDASFRQKSKSFFKERMKTSGAIFVSHDMEQVRQFCDAGLVLANGQLTYFDNIDDAIDCHLRLAGWKDPG